MESVPLETAAPPNESASSRNEPLPALPANVTADPAATAIGLPTLPANDTGPARVSSPSNRTTESPIAGANVVAFVNTTGPPTARKVDRDVGAK